MGSRKLEETLRFKVRGLAALLLLVLACGDSGTGPTTPDAAVPTSISLSATSLSFDAFGQTAQLTATVKDQNGLTMGGTSVSWTTSNPSVASVSSAGMVSALTDGTTTITATAGSVQATATVSVSQVAATIEIQPTSFVFSSVGDTTTFTGTVQDQKGVPISGTTVTWETSNTSVATVSDAGLVTAVADGTATVTALFGSIGATATVSVAQAAAIIELSPTSATDA